MQLFPLWLVKIGWYGPSVKRYIDSQATSLTPFLAGSESLGLLHSRRNVSRLTIQTEKSSRMVASPHLGGV
jgi:hypothetical protein